MSDTARREHARQRYRNAVAAGRCTRCRAPAEPGRSMCAAHLARDRETVRVLQQGRAARGLCVDCGRPVGVAGIRCDEHAARHNRYRTAYRQRRNAQRQAAA